MKKIILGIAALLGFFLLYIAAQSPNVRIARELTMNASAEKIFPYINNSQKANSWMPWADSDPGVKMVYSGPEEGVGSTTTWDSKGQMGTGKAEVVESVPNQSVKTQLTYTKPMEMSQLAEISLTAVNEKTVVRWVVTGQNTFIGRLFCFFMNMDKMVGGEFEKGLAKLKSIVEQQ